MQTDWNLESFEPTQFGGKREKWKGATSAFISKWKNRGDYLEKPETLKEALDDYEKWIEFYGPSADEFASPSSSDEVYYFWLKTQMDQNNPEFKAGFNIADDLGKELGNLISFFTINLSKISTEKQEEFLNAPVLKEYRYFLKRIFEKSRHSLDQKGEEIMILKAAPAYDYWEKMVSGFLSKEEREVMNDDGHMIMAPKEKISGFLKSKNKKVREIAADAINDIVKKYLDTAEIEINALMENKKVDDKIRGFNRPDAERHLGDDIKTETVDGLVNAVTERFQIARDFYKLKAKLLGQDKLKYYDRVAEYGKADKDYSYEEAVRIIRKVFEGLDPKFKEIFESFLDGKVDVYPKKGKRGGAFCVHISKSQPTYIMLNYNNTLNDVTTFAHECGHGINNEMVRERQNALYFDTPTSTAEVASTFMEDFVLEELMKNADDESRLSLMVSKLDDDVGTIMRQIACYNFEKELHTRFREKGYLSKEQIGKIFTKNMSDYMGEFVEQTPGSENWWISWPHIRLYFYVYSYASGFLISKAMQRKVRENKDFIENVKKFLSAGVSKSPEEIFEQMGMKLDREFWNSGLDEVQTLLEETEKLAKKLGKI